MADLVHLSDRTLITLTGGDVRSFLQGMITNDMDLLKPSQPLFTALLSPQGKFLFDFFLYDLGDSILLDCDARQSDDLTRRLTMYKMRADVTLEPQGDQLYVWASDKPLDAAQTQGPDPRHKALGVRAILTTEQSVGFKADPSAEANYYKTMMTLGIPSGFADMGSDKTLILEGNYAEVNAVNFTKGCYVGQENTARMMHRNKIRRRLVPITTAPPAEDGALIFKGDKKVGEVRNAIDNHATAYLRVEDFDEALTLEGGTPIHINVPDWLTEVLKD